ncbi:helix-turn-helix domain-containing protein [Liquorilactobacillus vini]|uniref:helix-turn-helix domain-containing protein n=1 Tax=Liquorilactobacillus vini TaxID=238015 RepID=UPI00029A8424|nr:helix-turn-helix transcriptional regulator [Liquorilactobacillus vini]
MINGLIIKKRRKELHISQKELAEGITTQGTISALERNSTSPNSDILTKILERLSLSLTDVLVGNEKIDNQKLLAAADKCFMNYDYHTVLTTLKKIKKITDPHQRAHYQFLKTDAKMWVKKDYDDAIFEYNQLLQETNDRNEIYAVLATCELGIVYSLKQDLEKSAFYFKKLPGLMKKLDLDQHIFWSLSLFANLSEFYLNIDHQVGKCQDLLTEALHFAKKNNSPFFVDSFYLLSAEALYAKNGEWTAEAIDDLTKSCVFAEFLDDKLELAKAQKHLDQINKQ